jgi:arginine exporter protein ArgO
VLRCCGFSPWRSARHGWRPGWLALRILDLLVAVMMFAVALQLITAG